MAEIKYVANEGDAWKLMRTHRQIACPKSTADTIIPPLGGQCMVKCHECGLEVHFNAGTPYIKG